MLTLVIFLAVRGHHAMLLGVRQSFESLPLLSVGVDKPLLDMLPVTIKDSRDEEAERFKDGRLPLQRDALEAKLAAGTWKPPAAGEAFVCLDGKTETWAAGCGPDPVR